MKHRWTGVEDSLRSYHDGRVTEARLSELRALIGHLNAVSEFDRVQRVGGN